MGTRISIPPVRYPEFPKVSDVGSAGNDISGAHRDKDVIEDEEGHGAAILSFKSHVKLKPSVLSYTTSAGKLRSKHPSCPNP